MSSQREEQAKVVIAPSTLIESHLRLEVLSENHAAQLKRQIMASVEGLTPLVSTQSQTLSERITFRGTYGRDDQSDIAAFGPSH